MLASRLLVPCVLTLILPVPAVAIDNLSMLTVHQLPHPGRDDYANFVIINDILQRADGVDVVVAVKEVGNSSMYAVLNINDDCVWAKITSQLSAEGYLFSSVPILGCEAVAREVDVTLSVTKNFRDDIRNFVHLSFPLQDVRPSEYNAVMFEFMQRLSEMFAQPGVEMTCFRKSYEMYFFTNHPDSELYEMARDLKVGELFTMSTSRSQSLKTYLDSCLD